jgi:hypothetical protein
MRFSYDGWMRVTIRIHEAYRRQTPELWSSPSRGKWFWLATIMGLLAGCTTDNPPVAMEPLDFSGRTFGCGDWYTYTQDATGLYVLALSRNDQADTSSQYSIGVKDANATPLVATIVKMSQAKKAAEYFCNDVRYPDLRPVDTLEIVAGQVKVTKGARHSNPEALGGLYKLNLEATGLKYRDETGEEHALPTLKADSISVGWLAG